jgi:hypothetical protein
VLRASVAETRILDDPSRNRLRGPLGVQVTDDVGSADRGMGTAWREGRWEHSRERSRNTHQHPAPLPVRPELAPYISQPLIGSFDRLPHRSKHVYPFAFLAPWGQQHPESGSGDLITVSGPVDANPLTRGLHRTVIRSV